MRTTNKYRAYAGNTAESYKNKSKNVNRDFFYIDNRMSYGYGSGYGSKYDSKNIKRRQIQHAPMERWGMLELLKKSNIELSQREKANLLIFGDIRGWEWAIYEKEKLRYEFDNINDIAEVK